MFCVCLCIYTDSVHTRAHAECVFFNHRLKNSVWHSPNYSRREAACIVHLILMDQIITAPKRREVFTYLYVYFDPTEQIESKIL